MPQWLTDSSLQRVSVDDEVDEPPTVYPVLTSHGMRESLSVNEIIKRTTSSKNVNASVDGWFMGSPTSRDGSTTHMPTPPLSPNTDLPNSLMKIAPRSMQSMLHSTTSSATSPMAGSPFKRARSTGNRLIDKNGKINMDQVNMPHHKTRFLSDLFTTLIEMQWRYTLAIFSIAFVGSWAFFACLYSIEIAFRGQFYNDEVRNDADVVCITQGTTFIDLMMFSMESQTTIGFGSRWPTTNCPSVVVLVQIQTVCGVMIQTLMAGLFFAKLVRPIKRAYTILFSENAVIELVNGRLCLQLRVGDMRQMPLASAQVKLIMICSRVSTEGELIPFYQTDMHVGQGDTSDTVLIMWPIIIYHEINQDSPFYQLTKQDINGATFELIAVLEGTVQATSATVQARTSYTPNEILWGRRLDKLVTLQRSNGKYKMDFSKFHNTYVVDCPTMSAQQMDELKEAGIDTTNRFERKMSEMPRQGDLARSVDLPQIVTSDSDNEVSSRFTVD